MQTQEGMGPREQEIITDRIEQTYQDIWEAQFDRGRQGIDSVGPDCAPCQNARDSTMSGNDHDNGEAQLNSSENKSGNETPEDPQWERPLSKKFRLGEKTFDSLMYEMHLMLKKHNLEGYENVLNKHPTLWEKGSNQNEERFLIPKVKVEKDAIFEAQEIEQSSEDYNLSQSFTQSSSSSSNYSVDTVFHTLDPSSHSSQGKLSTYSSTQDSIYTLSQDSAWSSSTYDTTFSRSAGNNSLTSPTTNSLVNAPFYSSLLDPETRSDTSNSMDNSDGSAKSDTSENEEEDPAHNMENSGGYMAWELQYRPEKSAIQWFRSGEYINSVLQAQAKIDDIHGQFSGLSDKACKMPNCVDFDPDRLPSRDNRSGSLMYDMHLLLGKCGLGKYESVLNNHPTLWDKHV